MVSHLILVFGLLCGGAVADLDSWDYAEDSVKPRSSDAQWTGFRSRTRDCNACLRTVTEIVKRAKDAKKIGIYTKDFYPCPYLTSKQNDICKNVMVFVRETVALNFLDNRAICAKANYCTPKYNSHKSPSKPLVLSSSNNRDWSGRQGELDRRRCKAKKNDDNLESKGPAEKDPSLDLANPDFKCRECGAIIREIREFIGEDLPRPYMLPYTCGQLEGTEGDHCFDMIEQNGDDIIRLLFANKPNIEICTAINECHKTTYNYCKACQRYIYYGNLMGYGSSSWEGWACSDFRGNGRAQCMTALLSSKPRIKELFDQNPHATANEVCQNMEMCAPLLLMSRKLN